MNHKPRITFLFTHYYPVSNGVGNCTRSMAQALVDEGYDVHVITCRLNPNDPVEESIGGVRIHRILDWTLWGSRALAIAGFFAFGWVRLLMRLRKIRPDIMFGMMLFYGYIAEVLRPFVGYKSVTLAQGSDVDEVSTFLQKFTVKGAIAGCQVVCATNSEFRDKMFQRVPRKDIALLPNCIGPGDVATGQLAYEFPDGYVHALSVGRMVRINGIETKGMSHAIQAIACDERFMLHLFGDGPLKEELEQLAEQLNVADRVVLHGNIPHAALCDAMRRADVLLFPSMTEGLSKTILEACYIGMPIITTAVGGQRDYLVQGQSVLFVRRGCPEDITGALSRIADDPGLKSRLACGAHQVYQENFTYKAFVERFEQVMGAG